VSAAINVPAGPPAPPPGGYGVVLRNRKFLYLWFAQILSLIAINSTVTMQLVLIERELQSATAQVGIVLAFNLPAALFSALSGVIVDRYSKKWIMFVSSATRIVTQIVLVLLVFLMLGKKLDPLYFIPAMYIVTFITSATGQFFGPAEGGMIPMLVGRQGLLAGNSLFGVTLIAVNAIGLLVLGPLGIKLLDYVPALSIAVAMYIGATIFVALVPRDPVRRVANEFHTTSFYRSLWSELLAGWRYALSRPSILLALTQVSLVGLLVSVMASIGPGYARRVLGLEPEDAVYIFWPAGLGLVIASLLVGRFGARFSRNTIAITGLFTMGIGIAGLGIAPDLITPSLSLTVLVAWFSLLSGIGLALIQIPAQTVIQEESSDEVRGRVLTVQFTAGSLVAVPPLLLLGALADVIGIPAITAATGLVILVVGVLNLAYVISRRQYPPRANEPKAPQEISSH
jgi:MFS family permease